MRATGGRNNGSAFRIQKTHCSQLCIRKHYTKDGLESKEINKLKYASDFDIQISIKDTESVLRLNWPRTSSHFL